MKKKILVILLIIIGLLIVIFTYFFNSNTNIYLKKYSNIEINSVVTSEIGMEDNSEKEVQVNTEKKKKIIDLILEKTYQRVYNENNISSYASLKIINIQCKVTLKDNQYEFVEIMLSNTGKIHLRNYTTNKNIMYNLNSGKESVLYDEIMEILMT